MRGFNDLPILSNIWPTIFNNLSIQDLLNCRLVNKKFKEYSDHTNGINKLIIGQPNGNNDDIYWYYNYKQIEDKDIISLKCFKAIQELSIFNLNTNLKYLKIYVDQLDLKEISKLINLQSIEFGYRCFDVQSLNLNNLKVFISNYCFFQLDTPELNKIQFYNINQMELKNPESIKHLITSTYDNKLVNFKSLEIMELRYIDQPVLNENLLSLFKNLKQLKINLNYDVVNYSNETINNSLIKILNDKIKLKRSIDIYLEGIKIENIDKFNELVSRRSTWRFNLNNYDLLDLNLPFIHYLYYFRLEECVNNVKNDLPSSFFDKFLNIKHVRVYNVKDIDGLNWFLNKLKCLNRLAIGSRVSLGQVFYDNLPNTIRYLFINMEEDINYDFILKLNNLIKFKTEVSKDLFDLVFKSFLNLKYLNRFKFYYKRRSIKIRNEFIFYYIKFCDKKYFYLNNGKKRQFLDYNQLIIECNKLRSRLNE